MQKEKYFLEFSKCMRKLFEDILNNMKILEKIRKYKKMLVFVSDKKKWSCPDSNSGLQGKHTSPSPLDQTAFGVRIMKQHVFKQTRFLIAQITREDLHLLRLKFQTLSVGFVRRYSPCNFPKLHTSNINELWIHESIANNILNTMVALVSSNLTDLEKP